MMVSGIDAVILKVFVPAGEDFLGIAPGSAIVGSEQPNGQIRIDYEGGIHNQAGFESFDRRAMQAAGRHAANYPTSARMTVPATELQPVGEYDTDTWTLIVANQNALDAWLRTRL
jgi:hypothetical protein